MVQDGATGGGQGGGKKKKNRNKNKKNKQQQQQDEANSQPELEQQTTSENLEVSQSATKQHAPNPVTNNRVNSAVPNTNKVNKNDLVLKNLAAEASQYMTYNWSGIQEAESKYQIYLASQRKACKEPEKKAGSEELDLFADSDEEAPVKPAKPSKKKAPKQDKGSSPNSSLAAEIAKARQHIKNSLECVDKIEANAGGAGASADVLKKLKDLELENKDLKKVTSDLKAMVLKLEGRVAAIENSKPAAAAASPAKAAPVPAADDEDDDDVDLFGSESDEEEDEEAAKVREERLAAYAAKKSKKPALIAKTSVLLDCKPWDDETNMDDMLKEIKKIEMDGLLWGANKLVPVGYGISKLQVMIVVEDAKVSIEELQEKICEIEDYVQSCDIAAMNKI